MTSGNGEKKQKNTTQSILLIHKISVQNLFLMKRRKTTQHPPSTHWKLVSWGDILAPPPRQRLPSAPQVSLRDSH